MKKLFNMAGLLLAITTGANAQIENVASKQFVSSSEYAAKASANANDKALAKFGKFYPTATDESWVSTKRGYTVRFSSNNIQHMVFLTKRGNVIASIRYYSEKELPSDVRQMIQYSYPSFSLKGVTEVNAAAKTAYLVIIEDAKTWKRVRVVDGEMDILEEFIKA